MHVRPEYRSQVLEAMGFLDDLHFLLKWHKYCIFSAISGLIVVQDIYKHILVCVISSHELLWNRLIELYCRPASSGRA